MCIWMTVSGWQKGNWHEASRVMSAACYVGMQPHGGCGADIMFKAEGGQSDVTISMLPF